MALQKTAVQNLSESTRAALDRYNRGSRLMAVTNLPGWIDVLEIIKGEIRDAEDKLISYRGTDPNELFALQNRLKGKRDLFQSVESEVARLTEFANEPSAEILPFLNY